MNPHKPKPPQFIEYVKIRNSGVTNMFDIDRVCELSTKGLTEDMCFFIMDQFEELAKEYNVKI